MKTRINARLDDELARKVTAVQRVTKKRLTTIVEEALERYCEAILSSPQSFELLDDAGFIGCAEGPADLSTNYKEEVSRSLGKKR